MNDSTFPPELLHLARSNWAPLSIGKSGDEVFRVDPPPSIVKIARGSERIRELERETEIYAFLREQVAVPKILGSGLFDTQRSYLWMEELEGVDGSRWADSPEKLMTRLARALRELHSIPIDTCPFLRTLEIQIEGARYNFERGLVNERDFEPSRLGRSAKDLFEELAARRPASEDLVFCHGDACLPNFILSGGGGVGLIDLGRAGVSDRHQDIALLFRSFRFNTKKDLPEIFLREYGLVDSLDTEKLGYYELLDEFY